MDNYIDFYSIPYNKDSFNQPYFKTSEARDAFFGKYTPLRVNAIGVNINLKFDYQFELKVNVDVVNMDNYNFAILNYNSKKFYCNIDDYEQISVNRSRVRVTRNPVFEVIDFFQYFTNLLIERDGSNYLDFTITSSNVSTYKGRYYPTVYSPNYLFKKNGTSVEYGFYSRTYVIFASGFSYKTGYPDNIDDMPSTDFEVDFSYVDSRYISLNGAISNYYCFIVDATDLTSDFLDAISPYIVSMHFLMFPYVLYGNKYEPFVSGADEMAFKWKDSSEKGFSYLKGYHVYMANSDDTYFECNISFSGDECYKKLEIYLGSVSNKLELFYKDFVSDSNSNGVINLRFSYIFSQTQISFKLWAYSNSQNSPIGYLNKGYISIFPLITNFDYTTDASAKWAAENRYYDQLTNNAISQRADKGTAQAVENLLTGTVQVISGARVMGLSNFTRGIMEPIQAEIDNKYYTQERDLLEAQARSSPDTFNSTTDYQSFFSSLTTYLYFNILIPFSSDFNRFKQDLLKYGTYVNKSVESVDTTNNFILKAFAQRNATSLPDMQYNKLYEYVKAGHKYIIGG